jgi:hypothetical protein
VSLWTRRGGPRLSSSGVPASKTRSGVRTPSSHVNAIDKIVNVAIARSGLADALHREVKLGAYTGFKTLLPLSRSTQRVAAPPRFTVSRRTRPSLETSTAVFTQRPRR